MKGVSKSSIVAAALDLLAVAGLGRSARSRHRQAPRSALAPVREAGARPDHPDRDAGALRALLPHRQHPGPGGSPGGGARPGQGALHAVRRAVGPAPDARPQPGQGRLRGDRSPATDAFVDGTRHRHSAMRRAERRERRPGRSHLAAGHLARSAHAHAAHGDGAGDRQGAGGPGRRRDHAEPGRLAVDRPTLQRPRADGRAALGRRWRAHHPPGRRARARRGPCGQAPADRGAAGDRRALRGRAAAGRAGSGLCAAQARGRRHRARATTSPTAS